ncbi:helix-turn-helix domain-containing protein [Geodermatophilus sp. CPCC 206100]|uniref:helix-turn-helix domain-containing protein n=1 Tax=Geodermatophilus sp. CPCC 206100 TaxID=3020054 RepID=UPI003AFFAF6D
MAARIGQRVRDLRHALGLDLRGLAERLAEEGHPIKLGQLSKLELGQRRVDVDDLVALAVVLNVTPGQLLMPAPTWGEDDLVALTPHRSVHWHRAWQWMCGDYWLDDSMRPDSPDDEYAWHEAARPHDPTGGYNFHPNFLYGREEDMHAVVVAVQNLLAPKAGKNSVSKQRLFDALNWYLTVSTGQVDEKPEPHGG